VQIQSTVVVQILSSQRQSSSPGDEAMRVEVRAMVNDGGTTTACQTVLSRGSDGKYTVGMRAGIQQAMAVPQPERTIGTRIDRYA